MRVIWSGMSVALLTCILAGCSGDTGESTATPDNPKEGLEAVKKLQGPGGVDLKAASKGTPGAAPSAPAK
jgi:hypothetical protein